MLTQYEARKLQADMKRELEGRKSTPWKCAAALAIVVGVSFIGPLVGLQPFSDERVAIAALDHFDMAR